MQYSLTVYQILFIAYSEKKCNKIVKKAFCLFIFMHIHCIYSTVLDLFKFSWVGALHPITATYSSTLPVFAFHIYAAYWKYTFLITFAVYYK